MAVPDRPAARAAGDDVAERHAHHRLHAVVRRLQAQVGHGRLRGRLRGLRQVAALRQRFLLTPLSPFRSTDLLAEQKTSLPSFFPWVFKGCVCADTGSAAPTAARTPRSSPPSTATSASRTASRASVRVPMSPLVCAASSAKHQDFLTIRCRWLEEHAHERQDDPRGRRLYRPPRR